MAKAKKTATSTPKPKSPWVRFGTNKESYDWVLDYVFSGIRRNMIDSGKLNYEDENEYESDVVSEVENYLATLVYQLRNSELYAIESRMDVRYPKPFLVRTAEKGKRDELYHALYGDVLKVFGVKGRK